MLTVMFVFSLFVVTVSADIIWYTDEYILVGDVNYTVNQTMNFSYREHTSVYLLLNSSYYNLTSEYPANITLTYLCPDISVTVYDELVLGFYVNSTGNVWCNISGFTNGVSYIVNMNRDFHSDVVADASGVIFFEEGSCSSNPLFEVYNNESATWYYSSFGGSVTVDSPANPNPPVALDATAYNITCINVSFSGVDNSDYRTTIERNTSGITSWARGSGTEIYNITGVTSNYTLDDDLSSGITYYYQSWCQNITSGNWSLTNATASGTTSGVTWYSSSFGGSVTVEEEGAPVTTWHSSSFGGSVLVTEKGVSWRSSSFGGSVTVELSPGWQEWSGYWKIGQTTVYDCTDPLDLKVDTDDINVTINNLTLTGANGWILADVNDDGVVDYLDISGVCFYYPWDESD